MYTRIVFILGFLFFGYTATAQNVDNHLSLLEESNIQLDSTDQAWLSDDSSFLINMTSLAKVEIQL